jgi:hypothetical protein
MARTARGGSRRKAPEPRLSAKCAQDQHDQCIGTVYVWPPVNGRALAVCECPSCKHTAKV